MIERMSFGTAQVRPGTFRVQVAPGEALAVGLGVDAGSAAELDGARAFVWTNYGRSDPGDFVAHEMSPSVPDDGSQRSFDLTLPPATLGTFIVTAYLDVAGTREWAADHAGPDDARARYGLRNRLVFRVSDPSIADLAVREVPIDKANARADSTDISTIDDLLDPQDGWYNLEVLQATGVNCVWFQVPYRLDPWAGRDPHDDAGSDYASTDWYSVDPDLSADARGVPGWDLDRQHTLANAAMKRLIDKAHELGLKVLLEIAPNHVGHNFIFRDDFDAPGAQDEHRRDYRQAVIDAAQLARVDGRLADQDTDEQIKNYAEWMLPQMYAARFPDGSINPLGASSVYETYSPDWYGTWSDVKHLNHGGHPDKHVWVPASPQNYQVLAYIGRVMAWAVTELGADGFRIDHALGMPFHFFEQTLPWVEMKAREQRGPQASLIWAPEDHDRKDYTQCVADVVQSMSYMAVLEAFAAGDVGRVRDAVALVEHNGEFLASGDHDEARASVTFGGDLIAFGNALMSMQLLGGPVLTLAGDEFGEGQQLRFKSRGGVPVLWQLRQGLLPDANHQLAFWIGRAAEVTRADPVAPGTTRQWLGPRGAGAPAVLAWERRSSHADTAPLLVVNNLERSGWTTATFDVGDRARAWLERTPDDYYQVIDLVGFDPGRYLWSRPITGRTLLQDGLGLGLQPRQIQALRLVRVQ